MIEILGQLVPTELSEILDPRVSALLIIDMQNGFCGSVASHDGRMSEYREIIPRIAELADACRRQRVPIFHARMAALPGGLSDSVAWSRMRLRSSKHFDGTVQSLVTFPIEGTAGAEFVSGLVPAPLDVVITKRRSSAFYGTDLDTLLRSKGIRTVLFTGCTTEGCVESSVRDASHRDYIPVVVRDCVASDARELHEASLKVMTAYRADVVETKTIIDLWRQTSRPATTAV